MAPKTISTYILGAFLLLMEKNSLYGWLLTQKSSSTRLINKLINILLSLQDSLLHKRTLLLGQADDARELKDNLDRRQRVVHVILSGYLTESQLQDYRRFVSTKPSLLIRQRHLDNLIRQGEEQLTRLAESLPQELAEAHGWSRLCPFTSPSPAPCASSFPPAVIPGPAHTVRSTAVTSL